MIGEQDLKGYDHRLERLAVLTEARSWIGTRYHDAADVKGAGVDCVMLLVRCYNAAGFNIKDPRPYPRDWFLHRGGFERFLNGVMGYAVETHTYDPGNVILWQVGRALAHGGIIVKWPLVIHANPKYGFVTEEEAKRCYIGKVPHKVFNPWGRS